MKKQIDIILKRFHFSSGIGWSMLSSAEQAELEANSTVIKLKKKKILIKQGTYIKGVYILKSGKLKVYHSNYDGSIQILFIYNQGELFGYRPLLSDEAQPMNIAAIEDCELLFINETYFFELINSSKKLSNQLLVSLGHEYSILTNRMNVFAQRGIKERLALALLILNEKFRSEDITVNDISEITLSRTDLANFIGTSLENLIRTIKFFKEKNFIRITGKSIFIQDFDSLFILSAIE